MQVCVLWNVWIIEPDGRYGDPIFVGYRDCESELKEFSTKMKEMIDDLIRDLDDSIKKKFSELEYCPRLLMKIKNIDVKQF